MGKIVGITGGNGVIGKILNTRLIETGFKTDCYSHDIREKQKLKTWFDNNDFDMIFHLAALVPVDQVNKNPFKAYSINVGGTINLLTCIKESLKNPKIFYASTSHVYKSSNVPVKEDDEIQPISLYGKTKYIAEEIVRTFSDEHNAKVCIGRIFSFYHKTQKSSFLYPAIQERIKTEDLSKPFFLRGAKNIRDIMNAEDVVGKILELMNSEYSGIVNIGKGQGIKIEEFVRRQTSVQLDIITDKDNNISSLVADVSKMNKIIEGK